MKFKELRETFDTAYKWEKINGWSDNYLVYAGNDFVFDVYFKEPEDNYDNSYDDSNTEIEVGFQIKKTNGTWVQDPNYSPHKNSANMFKFFKSLVEIIKDYEKENPFLEAIVFKPITDTQGKIYKKIANRYLPRGWEIRDGINEYVIIYTK